MLTLLKCFFNKISKNASVEIALQMPSVKTLTDHFHVAVRQATKEMASTV